MEMIGLGSRRAIRFVQCIQLVKLSAPELGLSSSQVGTV